MSKGLLIVDDSALVRKQLKEMLEPEGYEILFAKNGQEAVERANEYDFDVITMDINMPVLDGLSAVKEIMKTNPTAILMVSSLTTESATITMDCLDAGAIDFIAKPGTMNIGAAENRDEIIQKVKSLSRIPKRRLLQKQRSRPPRQREENTQVVNSDLGDSKDIEKIILIGSSTGGPGLIEQICAALPATFKHPVCVVQHMPEKFTASFATRLDKVSALKVQESDKSQELLPGNIYIAKGGVHLHFAKKVSGKIVLREESENPNGCHFQPSVDEMYKSALKLFDGAKIIGVILTGIGDDGAQGLLEIKNAGGFTMGESEESCTVYGMPRVAFEKGAVMEQLDFASIVKKLVSIH